MDVCRMRDTPIATFMNKFDREAMDPFALLDNIESILKIQCIPMTWPIGSGVDFKGVYDLRTKQILGYKDAKDPFSPNLVDASDLEAKHVLDFIGADLLAKLKEDLEMLETLMPPFSLEEYLNGIQTPVFFGSALRNFGVKELLDMITEVAPTPRPREAKLAPYDSSAEVIEIDPSDNEFTGFIFKIQANMDSKHRDRISFMRVCSGKFNRNDKIFHIRTGKEIKIATPLMFQARDRDIVEEAFAGDIIGLYDTGKYQIGDTFSLGKKHIKYTGIPSFSPELFMRVTSKDPMKAKHLEKGLAQLSEEGATQLFIRRTTNEKMLGAVGALQFEVVKFRLEDEYGVNATYEPVSWAGVRWLKFEDPKLLNKFTEDYSSVLMVDKEERLCFAVRTEWDLKLAMEKNPSVKFYKNSDYVE
jgi:peptide chain release factor 3